MTMQDMTALKNLVRVGTVSSIDTQNRTARVTFADKQDVNGKPLISGPLKVIQNPPLIPGKNVAQVTQARGGGSGEAAYESHTHGLTISPWLPDIGQLVVCLYLANGESDGFVLGAI
ncbi:hypothetical protein FACS1894111_05650 [Clostridia bacterium]|nr:hypothetical protein FACS1894111_05650 [Clostridia bacterium]